RRLGRREKAAAGRHRLVGDDRVLGQERTDRRAERARRDRTRTQDGPLASPTCPGWQNHTSTPPPTSVRTRLSTPFRRSRPPRRGPGRSACRRPGRARRQNAACLSARLLQRPASFSHAYPVVIHRHYLLSAPIGRYRRLPRCRWIVSVSGPSSSWLTSIWT